MPPANSHDDALLIRCPSCGQRFNIGDELRGKMVECGECDHQFEIQDEVILRGKKFYPGEKKSPFLDQVARVEKPLPKVSDPTVPSSFVSQTVPKVVEPVPPQRIIVGALALFAMVVTALFLILGATRGGVLDGVSTDKRVIIACFVSLLGFCLLIYTNPRAWKRMTLVGVLLGCALISLPLVFTGGSDSLGNSSAEGVDDSPLDEDIIPDPSPAPMSMNQLRQLIGTEPLEEERQKLKASGSQTTAVGLWLRKLKVRNRMLVREYVIREMNASLQTHFYPRGDDQLLVVTGVDGSLDKLALVATALGKVENMHEPIHVVEVTVDNNRFISGPMDQLTNPQSPNFYLLNRVEINSIDIDRISAAVKRLSEVKPVLFRKDISARLIELLSSDWVDFKSDVCNALLAWADDDGEAGKVALDQAVKLQRLGKEVPAEMIALTVSQKNLDVLPLLYSIWESNPTRWEPWFREIGAPAEKTILGGFDETSGSLRQSSVRILGQVGGSKSLPLLKLVEAESTDNETRILARNAILKIERRLMRNGDN